MLTPRTTLREPKLFSTACADRKPARVVPLDGSRTGLARGGRGGAPGAAKGAAPAAARRPARAARGGRSAAAVFRKLPIRPPSVPMSICSRAKPRRLGCAGRRRNILKKSTMPALNNPSRRSSRPPPRSDDSQARAPAPPSTTGRRKAKGGLVGLLRMKMGRKCRRLRPGCLPGPPAAASGCPRSRLGGRLRACPVSACSRT